MNYREMVVRMVTTRTLEIWNVRPIHANTGPSSRKEEESIHNLLTVGGDDFLMDLDEFRPTHA